MGRSINESNAMNTSRHPVFPAIRPTIPGAGHLASVTEEPRVSSAAFPLFPVHATAETTDDNSPRPRWKKRILLVDDDDGVLASVALVLEEEQYDVIMASDGYEAMNKCRHYQPDLILMDLNMPRLDGWQTIEVLDQMEPLVPIIIITARPQQYERAVVAGVDAFMEKPLDFPVLLDAVERLLLETPAEHLKRITSREFKTMRLGSHGGLA